MLSFLQPDNLFTFLRKQNYNEMKTCTIRLEKEDCFLDKGRISIDEWFIVETHGRASLRRND
ncbi:MAG: hypothetical protein EGQ00_08240 [Parabacteroides johnsonii]|nr:hypothetical protein [Parabacteroides johnsonii]